jgi:hypothetical protein
MKTVKICDPETKEVTTIPMAELAVGTIRVKLGDDPTEYYVDSKKLPRDGEYRHPPFGEEDRAVIRAIWAAFRDVHPQSLEDWENGFRMDAHPQKEIALWLLMSHVFLHITHDRNLTFDKRREIFNVVLTCMNNGPEAVFSTVTCHTLSRKRIQAIVDFMVEQTRTPPTSDQLRQWIDEASG